MTRRLGALLALAALAGCGTFSVQEDAPARIEKALAAYAAGLAARDADRVAGSFAPDGELVVPGREPIRGPEAIRAWVASLAGTTVLEQEVKGPLVQVVGPSALQRGDFRRKERLADGQVVETKGRFEAEWVRLTDGSWRLARITGDPPPVMIPEPTVPP